MQRPKSTTPKSTTPRSRTSTADQFLKLCRETSAAECNMRAQEIMLNQWRLMGYHWIACCDGQIPSSPVQCGYSKSGDPLYIARATTPGMTTILGVFHQPSGLCHLIWEGNQVCSKKYEILCKGPVLRNIQSARYVVNKPTSRARTPLTTTESDNLANALKVQSLRNPLRLSNMFRK